MGGKFQNNIMGLCPHRSKLTSLGYQLYIGQNTKWLSQVWFQHNIMGLCPRRSKLRSLGYQLNIGQNTKWPPQVWFGLKKLVKKQKLVIFVNHWRSAKSWNSDIKNERVRAIFHFWHFAFVELTAPGCKLRVMGA